MSAYVGLSYRRASDIHQLLNPPLPSHQDTPLIIPDSWLTFTPRLTPTRSPQHHDPHHHDHHHPQLYPTLDSHHLYLQLYPYHIGFQLASLPPLNPQPYINMPQHHYNAQVPGEPRRQRPERSGSTTRQALTTSPSSARPVAQITTSSSPQRTATLEQAFTTDPSPSLAAKRRLAMQLGMTLRQVQMWFQNRRAKAKRRGEVLNLREDRKAALLFHHTSVQEGHHRNLRLVTTLDVSE